MDQNFLALENIPEILKKVTFMSLTTCENLEPWCSPVFFAFDKELNFYWLSSPRSLHSRNIEANSNSSIVIYNSTAPDGDGWGLYFKGQAKKLYTEDDIKFAHSISMARAGKENLQVAHYYNEDYPRKYYIFTPHQAWVNGVQNIEGCCVDVRKEISLAELRLAFLKA